MRFEGDDDLYAAKDVQHVAGFGRGEREEHQRREHDERRDREIQDCGKATVPRAGEVVAQDDVIGCLDFESTGGDRHKSMLRSGTFRP